MDLDNHSLLPTLVQQFAAGDPALHRTVRFLYNQGAVPTEVMCALATHAYPKVPLTANPVGPDTTLVVPDFALLYEMVTTPATEYTPPNGVRLRDFLRTPTGDWEVPTFPRFSPVVFSRTFIFPDAVLARLINRIPSDDGLKRALRAAKPGEGVRIEGTLLVGLSSRAQHAVLSNGVEMTAMIVSRARVKAFDASGASDSLGMMY